MATREQVVETARKYIGVSWRHQGRSSGSGIDCIGLVALVLRDLDLSQYDYTHYARRGADVKFLEHFREAGCTPVPRGDMSPGDLLIFKQSVMSCHVAILSQKRGVLYIIHAHATRRAVVEEPLTDEWMRLAWHVLRLPGLED